MINQFTTHKKKHENAMDDSNPTSFSLMWSSILAIGSFPTYTSIEIDTLVLDIPHHTHTHTQIYIHRINCQNNKEVLSNFGPSRNLKNSQKNPWSLDLFSIVPQNQVAMCTYYWRFSTKRHHFLYELMTSFDSPTMKSTYDSLFAILYTPHYNFASFFSHGKIYTPSVPY